MNLPEYDFSQRSAFVTGAGGGMGEEITLSLLRAGAYVTAVDLKPCPEAIAKFKDRIHFAQGDIRNRAFVEETFGYHQEHSGGLDFLANVAGVLWFDRDKSLLEIDLDVWDEVFDINLKSMVLIARAAVPLMRKRGSGSMVHFSTIQWMRGDPVPQDAYQASKAAVSAMSRSLASQLAAEKIRSNTVLPGPVFTPMQERWNTEKIRGQVARHIPLQRIGNPVDLSQAAMFLFSDAGSFITGIDLPVDGGMLLRG